MGSSSVSFRIQEYSARRAASCTADERETKVRGDTRDARVRDDVAVAEGDTVLATAIRLHEALAGEILTRTDFRVPRFATADLAGQGVREVVARGKHLLVRTDADLSVHSHLGMDGAWRLYDRGERWRGRSFEVRGVLEIEDRVAVGHRLRRLEVLRASTEREVLGYLGPDVLGPDWDAAEATRRLTASPDRAVGEALIDQSVMAGPGNVYRSEACFLAGIDPRTPTSAVSDPTRLVSLVKSLMERNRAGGRRVTTDDPRPGHELWVYGRTGGPCRRCGTPIRSFRLGPPTEERVTFVCPSCQPSDR
jgi:endonuclease VIII